MKCSQCRQALEFRTVQNGIRATCAPCQIIHLSFGHLMHLSDSNLMTQLWEFIDLVPKWTQRLVCGRCDVPMEDVQFRHRTQGCDFHFCKKCNLVALKPDVLKFFEETKPKFMIETRGPRDSANRFARPPSVDRTLTNPGFLKSLYGWLMYTLTQTSVREYRATFLLGLASTVMSLFTTWLPYTSAVKLGFTGGRAGLETSIFISSLVHLDSLHLAGNLLLLWLLGPRIERELKTPKYVTLLAASVFTAYLVAPLVFPNASLAAIGLGPWVATLLGYEWARNSDRKLPLSAAEGITLQVPLKALGALLFFIELRGAVPMLAAGPAWFTLGQVTVSFFFGQLARRKLFPAKTILAPEEKGPMRDLLPRRAETGLAAWPRNEPRSVKRAA